ncbi:hypothetical protein ANN_11540 [Periplaneta americana]|uniref:Kazal-like domain-containing protein n=1 Tax=Periplaneta americana TaxID=6978 RepID=A0ABQ8T746_PERAM|nr:hypothetical protein ANN_11540 [Periplaneta americana]
MKLATALTLLASAQQPEKDCSHTHFTPFSVHKEICGSDGKTYINQPHLDYENCINDKHVTVVREGWCDVEEGKRVQEEHRKFMAEYAKQIKQALKEGRTPNYIADAPMPDLDNYPDV